MSPTFAGSDRVATTAIEARLTGADIAIVLGVSSQRVSQLLNDKLAEELT
jgi:transcriptional regulator with XRE-family HTH domain